MYVCMQVFIHFQIRSISIYTNIHTYIHHTAHIILDIYIYIECNLYDLKVLYACMYVCMYVFNLRLQELSFMYVCMNVCM